MAPPNAELGSTRRSSSCRASQAWSSFIVGPLSAWWKSSRCWGDRLPDQFFKDWLGTLGLGLHDVPLGRGGQGDAQVPLEIIDRGPHRRLTHQPHHHARATRLIDRALVALRAGIARLERFVTHLDLLGARVGVGPVAAVPLPLARHLGIILGVGFCGHFRSGLRAGVGFRDHALHGARWRLHRGLSLRRSRRTLRALQAADHRRGFLGLHAEEHLPQAADRGLLVAYHVDQVHIRPDHGLDRLVVVRVEFLGLQTPQNLLQFVHVQLDDRGFRLDHEKVPRRDGETSDTAGNLGRNGSPQ